MGHKHSVYDSDTHFSISAITRAIKNESSKKTTLIQGDHNSERFSFDLPRYIEGHDMMNCNLVEVHFTNKDEQTGDINKDYYEVKDMQISPADANVIVFSWLIDERATLLAGLLEFQIKFKCMTGGVCDYKWNTAINSEIAIASALDNSEEVVERTPNVVDQWRSEIFGDAENAVANINLAEQEAIEAVQKAGEDITNVAEIAKADVFKVTANAIKGTASGEVIRIDDVSKVEHEMAVKVHGKNQFNMSVFEVKIASGYAHISAVSGSSITVTTPVGYEGSGNCGLLLTLKELCPSLKAGRMYVLSGESPSSNKCIYLRDTDVYWDFGTAKILSENDINSKIAVYGFSARHGDGVGDCIISNIQIEEGTEATEFTPYIAPETVEVTRCGKNFWHSKNLSYPRTVSGVTIDYDPDTQIYTFNGTSTSPGDLYVLPNNTHIMTINAGETWTLKVEVMGGNIDGVATSSGKISPLVNTSDYKNTIHANVETLYTTKTYTESADIAKMYFYVYASGIVFNNFKCRIQFELNEKPTEFEKSTGLTNHTPSADGTVSDMMSTSPNMTILTDTEGVVIECEYNVDTKTYIDKKFEELKALLQG